MSEKHIKSTQHSTPPTPEAEPAATEAEAAEEITSENSEAKPAQQAPAPQSATKRRDPIRPVTVVVLLLALLLFSWRIVASRYTPSTDQARVRALIVPLTPRVSGFVTEVDVRLHSLVEEGDVLFQLDRRPYEAAVEAAEASLDNST
jgi:multidrug resistance efflux pump